MTKYPWEPQLPAIPLEDRFEALRRDMATMVTHTGLRVISGVEAVQMTVNTPRGQIVPRGAATYRDPKGTLWQVEIIDIGMPQPGAEFVATVAELVAIIHETMTHAGYEVRP